MRYDDSPCVLVTPPCELQSGPMQLHGGTVLPIRIMDTHLLEALRGMDRLLFQHVLQNWDRMQLDRGEEEVVVHGHPERYSATL